MTLENNFIHHSKEYIFLDNETLLNQREKIFPRTFFYFQVQWNDVDGGYGKHFFEFNHDISTAAIPQKPPVLKPLRHRV